MLWRHDWVYGVANGWVKSLADNNDFGVEIILKDTTDAKGVKLISCTLVLGRKYVIYFSVA